MNKIIKKLEHDIKGFEKKILNTRVIHSYPLLPVHFISILANYKSKVFQIYFNNYVEISRLEKIISQLVKNNDLFRSSIGSKGGKLFIQEHEPTEDLKIPIVDFSCKNDQEREKIIDEIFKCKSIKKLGTQHFFIKFLAYKNLFLVLRHLYVKTRIYKFINNLLSIPLFDNHETSRKNALGKFILFKNNIKEYTLILYLDHFLLDDVSVGHLMDEIERSYHSGSYQNNKPLSYSSLASQLSLGPKIKDPQIIIDKLKLKDYFEASQKIKKELRYSDYYVFRFNATINDAYQNELIEVSIFISAIICSKIFHIINVPITLLSGNRKYEALDFYNTVGLFQDFVPLLIELGNNDYKLNKTHFDNYLKFLSDNNINILYLVFNKYDDEFWQNLIHFINPQKIVTSEPVLTLNIEFDQENNSSDFEEKSNSKFVENNTISIVKTKDKTLINNLKRKGGIILWINISKTSIHFTLESLFPIEEKYFGTFVDEIREFTLPR